MSKLDLGFVHGSVIYATETEPPDAALGIPFDWALAPESGNLYRKSDGGEWTLSICIKGERGEQGVAGPKGDSGGAGAQGIQGPKGEDGKTPTLSIDEKGHLIAEYN